MEISSLAACAGAAPGSGGRIRPCPARPALSMRCMDLGEHAAAPADAATGLGGHAMRWTACLG